MVGEEFEFHRGGRNGWTEGEVSQKKNKPGLVKVVVWFKEKEMSDFF